jgi:Ohr subfamily peroxiredoxin
MSKTLYTAEATVTGGRQEGHGRTSDGNLEVDIRPPAEVGGDGTGTNPEQLFAVGYAACFESALSLVARRMKTDADDARVDSKVSLHPTEDRGFKLSVQLDVTLPSIEDRELAAEIVRTSHNVCPYSMAVKGNIDVKLTVNGSDVS